MSLREQDILHILHWSGRTVDYKPWCHRSSSLLTSSPFVWYLPRILWIILSPPRCKCPARCVFPLSPWSFCFYKWHFLKRHTRAGGNVDTAAGFLTGKGNSESLQCRFGVIDVQCGNVHWTEAAVKMLVNAINSAWELRVCFFFDQLSRYTHFLGIPSSHTHTDKETHRHRTRHSNMHTLHTGTFTALRIYRLIYFALCFIFTALRFRVRERLSLKSSQCLQAAWYDVTSLKWPRGKYPLAANLILWH